jgi:hypothetical protein
MATRLSRWPFEQVWDEVRHRENAVDGQYRQLRKAGDLLDEAGFDPERARKRRPWQGR